MADRMPDVDGAKKEVERLCERRRRRFQRETRNMTRQCRQGHTRKRVFSRIRGRAAMLAHSRHEVEKTLEHACAGARP